MSLVDVMAENSDFNFQMYQGYQVYKLIKIFFLSLGWLKSVEECLEIIGG